MNCTWKGCAEAAQHPLKARDGEVWANLCGGHKAEFDEAPQKGGKAILRTWVLAQGGAQAATGRMLGTATPSKGTENG